MSLSLNQAALDRLRRGIGEQVRSIVHSTAVETINTDRDQAVDLLDTPVNDLVEVTFDRDWSRNALETLRRGGARMIQIG